ncbi:MAG: DNA recombination protein RmuC, partial [Armatimonadota bacterium]
FKLESSVKDEFTRNREELNLNLKTSREEIGNSLKLFGDSTLSRMSEIAALQKNQLDTFSSQLLNLTKANESGMDKMTQTIEGKLKSIQDDNNQKLEKMRETVDEKLHKTLEQRLGESFKIVSERLEQVQRGLGEMQNLATGVGDLKKVLSNVKTRGILGEIQLENILEQILTPEQYEKNVVTKEDSRESVEFAVKLPGKDDDGQAVYLPMDSKFPLENYYVLVDAYEKGDLPLIEESAKLLENSIKKFAKDIKDKYINPPNTTDFGIMFLPTEGLYAEIVRRTSLIEVLSRDLKILVTGPSTLAALLNSLQMGFKTLAIEKRSSEVWKILGAVKTEFDKFGKVLESTQKKISQAGEDLDELVGKRTKKIQSTLKKIHEVSTGDPLVYLTAGDEKKESCNSK